MTTVTTWTSPALTGTGDAAAVWVATTLREAGLVADGLYVATTDNGAREALAFWAAGQETGFAFASPAAFPWTLSNSVTGAVSKALGVTGPCCTYVGAADALEAAEEDARADLDAGLVRRALVVTVHGDRTIRPEGGGPVELRMSARVLDAAAAGRSG